MKKVLLLMLATALVNLSYAQSKVFKEVSDEISSQVTSIRQDNALVGYLVFTRLEKASEDSFNYKVTIMDENLNDIGSVNFREESIYMQGVAFEQDVLCLAYFKTNVFGKKFNNSKAYKAELPRFRNQILLQFLGLNGKILKSNTFKVEVAVKEMATGLGRQVVATGKMKVPLQLLNVADYGFACMYGDDNKTLLTVFKPTGDRLWQKTIKEEPTGLSLLASGGDIYMVSNNSNKNEKSYELHSYGVKDSVEYPKVVMKDKQSHELAILSFDNSPETGKPYISGYVKSKRSNASLYSAKGVTRGYYAGVYAYQFNGHGKSDTKEMFSYWDDESNSSISRKGYYRDVRSYAYLESSFKDYAGNTYFVGNSFVKRPRWGSIASSVILAPLIFPSMYILMLNGTQKAKLTNPILLKLDPKGSLSYATTVENSSSRFTKANGGLSSRYFSTATDAATKTKYMLVKDNDNTSIYNVNTKKVTRTIPVKDGNSVMNIYPAKEGHIMVAEYNKKEKYTRVSIETL